MKYGCCAIALLLLVGSERALAVPDCWGVLALNSAGQKVARISCSDDGAPGTAASYTCNYTWKIRTVDGVVRTLAGSFVSASGESNVVKYEHYRVQGFDRR